MLSKLYKTLWTRIGGRPWTEIIRDSYHDNPLLWILGIASGVGGLGIILGHIFW